MWLKLVLKLLILNISLVHSDFGDQIVDKIDILGWKKLTSINCFDKDKVHLKSLMKKLSQNQISSSYNVNYENFNYKDYYMIYSRFQCPEIIYLFQKVRPYHFMIALEENRFNDFKISMKNVSYSNSFYIVIINSNNDAHLLRCQTFANEEKVVFNDILIRNHGYKLTYDLEGGIVTSIDLTWKPFQFHQPCNDYKGCVKVKGFFADVMQILQKEFNFTWK